MWRVYLCDRVQTEKGQGMRALFFTLFRYRLAGTVVFNGIDDMTILLKQVIDGIEMACDAYTEFYDRKTGETVSLPDPIWTGESDEELEELLDSEPDRFLRFPTKFEIHEYSIMENFTEALPAGKIRNELAQAIRGKGAFRRFKNTIRYYGIEQLWYDFLENAYREIAIRWCKKHDLKYIEK